MIRSEERILFDSYLKNNKEFEEFASTFGITNLYKDSNLQQLQQALYLGLHFCSDRQSADATDCLGDQWELKSLNLGSSHKGFSTANPMTQNIIDRYRKSNFAFSIYNGTTLTKIYVTSAEDLECYFERWKNDLQKGKVLNNPNISLSHVIKTGIKVYDCELSMYVDDPVLALYKRKGLLS